MSVPFASAVAPPQGAAVRRRIELPRWLREPLVHFVVLGAVLFAADDFIASRAGDPHTIVVDAAVDAEAIAVFEKARDRAPNKDELYALRRVWLDNEVLYREGLAMGLDRGDKAIRERVIFKALSVVDAGIKLPPKTMRRCASGSSAIAQSTTSRHATTFKKRCRWPAHVPSRSCSRSRTT